MAPQLGATKSVVVTPELYIIKTGSTSCLLLFFIVVVAVDVVVVFWRCSSLTFWAVLLFLVFCPAGYNLVYECVCVYMSVC